MVGGHETSAFPPDIQPSSVGELNISFIALRHFGWSKFGVLILSSWIDIMRWNICAMIGNLLHNPARVKRWVSAAHVKRAWGHWCYPFRAYLQRVHCPLFLFCGVYTGIAVSQLISPNGPRFWLPEPLTVETCRLGLQVLKISRGQNIENHSIRRLLLGGTETGLGWAASASLNWYFPKFCSVSWEVELLQLMSKCSLSGSGQ